jgi:hypothetical protein
VHGLRSRSWIGALLGAALVVGALGAVAFATVTVYQNPFAHRGDVRELKKQGGKACMREFSRTHNRLVVIAKRAPKNCPLRLPVAGDQPRPDHVIKVDAKLSKETPKSVRRRAYVGVALRVGGKSGYELRIYPRRGRFELLRRPNGAGFPDEGRSRAIRGVGKTNTLRLQIFGRRVVAGVNGRQLASMPDRRSERIGGRRIQISLGNRGNSKKNTKGGFDSLMVGVPDP